MAAPATSYFLQFAIEGEAHALDLQQVERVIRAVELRPLPGAPRVIRGMFSLHGAILPVADPRRRDGLPDREIALEDRIIITRTASRRLGLLVQGDVELTACAPSAIAAGASVFRGLEQVAGIARLPDGLVVINDVGLFLSEAEETRLAEALDATA